MTTTEEKIAIFLTDQARGRKAGRVADLSQEIMIAVTDFYKQPEAANGFREEYGMKDIHKAGWDSGGFQFLMGKLKGVPKMVLPCGIEVPIDASRTVDLYKRVGAKPTDLPIQLDLPPRFDLPPDSRRQLIEQSARYYWEMVQDMPFTVPTIHGWTLEEVQYNLELITDPEKLAMGTYIGTTNGWTMGNMNPHDGRVAAGTFSAPEKSAVDYVNNKRKKVGVGSYKALTNPRDYVLHTDNSANPRREELKRERVASSIPGSLDVREGKPFIDTVKSRHKIATPVPGKVELGIELPENTPMSASPRKLLAVGTNAAEVTGPLGEKRRKLVASGTQAAAAIVGKKRVPYTVVIDRIAMVLNYLREDYDVFMLGGASPHMQHQVFLSGAKWTDTSAWRVKAVLGEIYLPDHSSGHSSFGIGYSQKAKRMDEEARDILIDCLEDPRHPFSGMHWKRFMEVGHMLMPQWKRKVLKHNYEARPFVLRAMHNAYVLKCREEEIANEYVNDPDRYYRYIKKRVKERPILSKRLTALWNRIKRPYVQEDLRVYMKGRKTNEQR